LLAYSPAGGAGAAGPKHQSNFSWRASPAKPPFWQFASSIMYSSWTSRGGMMTERIGYIGLGIMGRGMARNLLKAGFPLTVWNRTASRMDELVGEGAVAASSPADVAANSDLIMTCVSDTPDVEAVILGEIGVIHGAKPGALV